MDTTAEIKKLLSTNKLVLGTNVVMKGLRGKTVSKVFVTKNCPTTVKADVVKYARLSGAEVVDIELDNEGLGTICKKSFLISMVGVQK